MDDVVGWLDERTAAGQFSGAILVRQGEAEVFRYARGIAHRGHGVPVGPGTRFGVASIGKVVTAVAALRLVDRGVLDLHAPILDLLAPGHRPAALTREHTLHHLLSHTSGLANYHDDTDPTWASFTACWDRVPTYRVRRPADLLPLFRDLPAVEPPGGVFRYNDAGFVLAGLILEDATGRPYADIVADEVLAPAGMADSGIESLDDDPARLATGYLVEDGVSPDRWRANTFSVPVTGMPDGGLIATPDDLVALMDAIMGGRLLSPALTAAMLSRQTPASPDPAHYGYGCHLVVVDGATTIAWHGGSDPGVSALLSHHIASDTTIAVVCNLDRGAGRVTKRIEDALGLADPRFAEAPASDPQGI